MQSLLIRIRFLTLFNACKNLLVCYNKCKERFLICGVSALSAELKIHLKKRLLQP